MHSIYHADYFVSSALILTNMIVAQKNMARRRSSEHANFQTSFADENVFDGNKTVDVSAFLRSQGAVEQRHVPTRIEPSHHG
jgi:hypothetical protein